MYNDLFSIGPVTVHGYGLMIAIGVLAALIISDKRATKRGLSGDLVYSLVIWTVVGGFLGAKVLFIITYLKKFLADPVGFISGSGFVVYGGIITGIGIIALFCKIKKVSFIDYIDLVMPSVALAQGFGRLGCLLAGCCYGRPTDSAIGIIFTHSDFAPNGIKLMPTQIMMSVGDFIIAAILFYYVSIYDKKRMERAGLETPPASTGGRVTLLYLILYSIGRFSVEFFRNDYRGSVGILSTSQFIAIITAVVATVVYFIMINRRGENKDVNV